MKRKKNHFLTLAPEEEEEEVEEEFGSLRRVLSDESESLTFFTQMTSPFCIFTVSENENFSLKK
jgi:hypothetical protein